jgi:integrase/recombinase XerD
MIENRHFQRDRFKILKVESYEGKTPAIGTHEARQLLAAPDGESLKGKRDRAILATLLNHALRRVELCALKVKDVHARRGVPHFRAHGKGGKLRYLPIHVGTWELISDYLVAAGHVDDRDGALFRPLKNNTTGALDCAPTADGFSPTM